MATVTPEVKVDIDQVRDVLVNEIVRRDVLEVEQVARGTEKSSACANFGFCDAADVLVWAAVLLVLAALLFIRFRTALGRFWHLLLHDFRSASGLSRRRRKKA